MFELSSGGTLVNVQTLRRGLAPSRAAEVAGLLEGETVRALGAPTSTSGAATEAHLRSGLLHSYVAEHVFTDYRATIVATDLGKSGVMVREQYLSLAP